MCGVAIGIPLERSAECRVELISVWHRSREKGWKVASHMQSTCWTLSDTSWSLELASNDKRACDHSAGEGGRRVAFVHEITEGYS